MAEEVIKTTSCCNDAMMGGLLGVTIALYRYHA